MRKHRNGTPGHTNGFVNRRPGVQSAPPAQQKVKNYRQRDLRALSDGAFQALIDDALAECERRITADRRRRASLARLLAVSA